MTMKNIVLGLLCCSLVSTGLFLTACKPSENGAGVIIHEDGTTSMVEGPGDTSRLASFKDVGLSIRAMAPQLVPGSQVTSAAQRAGGSEDSHSSGGTDGAGGSDSGDQKTTLKGMELAFEELPNVWNGAVYDRATYQQVFLKKYGEQKELPQTVTDGSVICLDFGEYQPKEITVMRDPNRYTAARQEAEAGAAARTISGADLETTLGAAAQTTSDAAPETTASMGALAILEIPLTDNSFPVSYDGGSEIVYDIQCGWSNGNSVEYALIIRSGV